MATSAKAAAQLSEPLVRAAQAGDRTSLDGVLEALAAALLPYAAALTGDRPAAEVLLAETISRIFERFSQLEEPAALVAWSRRVMFRLYVDGIRVRLRRPEVSIDLVTLPTADPASADLIDLRVVVDRLPRADRALLVLHYWMGLTLPECASEFGIPVGTAKSRLHRVLEHVRRASGGL